MKLTPAMLGEKLRNRPWLEFVLVSVLFSVVFIVNIAATGFDPGTHYIGRGMDFIDWNAHFWSIWHYQQSLMGNDAFFHTSLELYPHGLDTFTMHGTIIESMVGGFLALFFGMEGALLAVIAFTLLGNALGGYWLVRKMTGEVVPGLVIGLAFSMNGIVAWSINTGNLDHGIWLWHCLFIWYFIRMLEDSGWKNTVLASVFAWLAMLTGFSHILLLTLFGIVLVLCRVHRLRKPQWKMLALFVALTTSLLSPLLYSFLEESRTRSNEQLRPSDETAQAVVVSGAEAPQSLFARPVKFTRAVIDDSIPAVDYLPWVDADDGKNQTYFFLWLLVLVALVVEPRKAWPWVVAGAAFFLVALGPVLKGGVESRYGAGYPGVPMPYMFFYKNLPFFYRIQFPSRIFAYSILALGVAGGLGTFGALRLLRGRRAWLRNGLVAALLLGALFEMSARWDVVVREKPYINPFYSRLYEMPERFAIIEVPFNFNVVDSKHLFMQVRHEKPVFNGIYPPYFADDPSRGLVRGNMFLRWIVRRQAEFFGGAKTLMSPISLASFKRWFIRDADRLPMQEAGLGAAAEDLVEIGFRYLLVHKTIVDRGVDYQWPSDRFFSDLERHLGEPVYEDWELVAFDLRRSR